MEQGAQVKRGSAVRLRKTLEQRRCRHWARCCRAPSLRRRRSGWRRGCWARCWCTGRAAGLAGRADCGGGGLPGPAQRPARPGRALLSRPHAAQPGSLWSRGARVCLCNLRPLLLHERHPARSRGRPDACCCARWSRCEPRAWTQMALNRGLAPGAPARAAHLRPQPALPGAGAHAPEPQWTGPARSGLAAAVARRRIYRAAKCW